MKIDLNGMATGELARLEKTLYNHGLGHTQTIADLCFARAEGDYIFDTDGGRYIDFNGTLNLPLGHARENAREVMARDLPVNAVSYATRERLALCLRLKELFPSYTAFQFYSAGTEANEGAIRYAIAITGKDGFGAFRKSYHGRTRATVSLCNMKDYNGNRMQGYFRVPYPERAADVDGILAELDELVRMDYRRNCAGIFLEPVLGKLVTVPPEGFIARLKREICEKYDVLLIADEYLTSIRTGVYSYSIAQGAEPDIMTIGKCLGNGVPFAVLMCHERHAQKVWNVKGSTTFGGNPFACGTVLRNLDTIEEQRLLDRAAQVIEPTFREEMRRLEGCAAVQGVHVKGALLGIEFADRPTCIGVSQRCARAGVLASCIKNVLRITPSLNIDEAVLREGLRIIADQILEADAAGREG